MKIIEYDVELNDKMINVLVEKRSMEYPCGNLQTPGSIYNMMETLFALSKKAEEHSYLIALTSKSKPVGIFMLSRGTISTSILNTREVYVRLLLCGAPNFVLVHNHPSGDTSPSETDIRTTKKIKQSSDIMGVSLLDHIIVGNYYTSFVQEGLL